MLNDFFGDETTATQPEEKRERQGKTCADEVEMPPAPRKRFAGLKNQGATCYLNSFYQLIFMMPELKRLFVEQHEKFDATWKTRIFNGFKRLFCRLELLDAHSQTTEFMNEVFGWNKSEMLNQHDIQEAMRIIFGFLDDAFKGTALSTPFGNLLKGKIANYINCAECGSTSQRLEDFWEFFLNIKSPHGHLNQHLEAAMKESFSPELMQGSNQYSCAKCDKKVDAERGMRVVELPMYASFYVNRFEFDQVTFERKKLKADFDFPQSIDLAPYVAGHPPSEYEFFAGIIHRGTAYSGHYHVIIRDLEEELRTGSAVPMFNDFNDTVINPVDLDYLNKFKKKGEHNFYLLIYRRKTPFEAAKVVPFEDDVTLAVRIENGQIERARLEYKQLQSCIRVFVTELNGLVERGVVSVEDLQTIDGDIDGETNPKFVLNTTKPTEFQAAVENHFKISMSDHRLFLVRVKANSTLYYVEEVDLEGYDYESREGMGMNSQLVLVNQAFLDFPIFTNFKSKNVV